MDLIDRKVLLGGNNVHRNMEIYLDCDCPLWQSDSTCGMNKYRRCTFGLSTIDVPKDCPLKSKDVTILISLDRS